MARALVVHPAVHFPSTAIGVTSWQPARAASPMPNETVPSPSVGATVAVRVTAVVDTAVDGPVSVTLVGSGATEIWLSTEDFR